MKTHLVSCMKDEGPFILEWVAYHRAIGFDQITILSNDLTDGSGELLDALQASGFIRHFSIQVPPDQYPQQAGYRFLAQQENYFAQEDWILVLDGDEFLNSHMGEGSVRALIDAVAFDNDILVFHFANFGDRGQSDWQPGFVTEQYRWREPLNVRHHLGVKSLFHGMQRFKTLDNHHPSHLLKGERIKIRFPDGEILEHKAGDAPLYRVIRDMKPERRSFEFAQINHYIIKSYDSFYFKRARGRGWGTGVRHTDQFFVLHSEAATELDESINNKLEPMRTCFDEMMGLPEIRQAQEAQITAYQQRIEKVHDILLKDGS